MNDPRLVCQDEQRREVVVRDQYLHGLDYLEVSEEQRTTLSVYFMGKVSQAIKEEIEERNAHVHIEGGRRIRGVQVVDVRVHKEDASDLDDWMEIDVDRSGDLSPYTLRLVELEDDRPTNRLMRGFDPRYAQLEFGFLAGCSGDLDCKPQELCPPPVYHQPEIDYLAKDYASFRQLIMDRLALIIPGWQEPYIPDLTSALVEVLAYVGDHLSYYQDALATEAYLESARQRISVRRHARLVDYQLHEGCNARTWVFIWTDDDLLLDLHDVAFIAGYDDATVSGTMLTLDDLYTVPANRYEVFEPLVDGDAPAQIRLYAAHKKIDFYTWGDQECCLPRGATAATLSDEWVPETAEEPTHEEHAEQKEQETRQQQQRQPHEEPREPRRRLHLKEGDVLIFEEVVGPRTGNPADADQEHRHAVRLTRVQPGVDLLFQQPVPGMKEEQPTPIVEIEWAKEDALPFPLCLSSIGLDCELIENVSVARGNVVLADHGETVGPDDLGTVPEAETIIRCEDECHPAETVVRPGRFRPPPLKTGPVTFRQSLPAHAPASYLLTQDPHQAMPQVELTGTHVAPSGVDTTRWAARRDLLGSRSQDPHFVVEIDNNGRAHLRFGNGELGRTPEAGTRFDVTYRVGNGPSGNVGADTVTHIVFRRNFVSGVMLRPRNPLSARGGTSPEPLVEAKLFAPHTFRTEQQRAITADDYARLAEQHRKVQRAAATLRWTGSWYEALVTIDPRDDVEADKQLLDEIERHLCPYRRIGHDLRVAGARYVPLEIAINVCVRPDFLLGHVKAALLGLFSNRVLPDGRRGFFHPDNLSFGEDIFLSTLVAAAQAVPGVESVAVTELKRLFEMPNQEIENGVLPLGSLEIARLDNDPNFPENGLLRLKIWGGR